LKSFISYHIILILHSSGINKNFVTFHGCYFGIVIQPQIACYHNEIHKNKSGVSEVIMNWYAQLGRQTYATSAHTHKELPCEI